METTQQPEPERTNTSIPAASVRQYSGWLVSNEFYKRSLAVVGHYLAGVCMISVGMAVVVLVLGTLVILFN